MKKSSLIFSLFLSLLLLRCEKDPLIIAPAVEDVITEASASLDTLSDAIDAEVRYFAQVGLDTVVLRQRLLTLFQNSTLGQEFIYTNPQGILQIIEPAAYYAYQGVDVSQQAHIVKAFQTKSPVLSDAFQLVEGFQAVVEIHPIVRSGQLTGALSTVFVPEVLLGRIIPRIIEDEDFEIWVMEKSGTVLWDQDAQEIGLNTFTAPEYTGFPELIQACRKIAAEDEGETTYSFYQAETTNVVVKRCIWKTMYVHGNEWKIIQASVQ